MHRNFWTQTALILSVVSIVGGYFYGIGLLDQSAKSNSHWIVEKRKDSVYEMRCVGEWLPNGSYRQTLIHCISSERKELPVHHKTHGFIDATSLIFSGFSLVGLTFAIFIAGRILSAR
jgi:hypothetical protein